MAQKTTTGKLIVMPGIDAPTAIAGILELFPLDDFVTSPLSHMGGPEGEHQRILGSGPITSTPIERFAYYPIAEASFAVVQTAETRPYANFILKKGVV